MNKHIAQKPLYGTHIYIRDKILKNVLKAGGKLEITIPALGTTIIDVRDWVKGKYNKDGQQDKMEKVFKIPNKPMILYGGDVPLELETTTPISINQQKLI